MRPSTEYRADFLSTVKGVAASLGVDVRNPKWTSYGGMEVDLFARSKGDFELAMAAIEPLGMVEFTKSLDEAPQYKSPEDTVNEARSLFDAERYWESHEVLEGLWRSLKGEEKEYVQGVILVCAAMVHWQKEETEVGLGVLRRALRQLSRMGETYTGIDNKVLTQEVEAILKTREFRPFKI